MGFGYDDELPGGFQDADLEMAELEREGNRRAKLDREIAALEAEIQYGIDHPFAGVCGEDDAREQRLADLKERRGW